MLWALLFFFLLCLLASAQSLLPSTRSLSTQRGVVRGGATFHVSLVNPETNSDSSVVVANTSPNPSPSPDGIRAKPVEAARLGVSKEMLTCAAILGGGSALVVNGALTAEDVFTLCSATAVTLVALAFFKYCTFYLR